MNDARRPLVAGNWKLHNSVAESLALVRTLREGLSSAVRAEVVVAPVYTSLVPVAHALEGSSIGLSAQDMHWEPRGAFTGAVSAPLLVDVGCTHVIVGHSERRQLFGETDEGVQKKVRAALDHELVPIACVGETLEEREANRTLAIVLGQLDAALGSVRPEDLGRFVVAYEPVWAIGTGRTARPEDAQEVHAAIRKRLSERHGARAAETTRVLYGGSVKADNAKALMSQPDIDGALVGGASLQADSFMAIVRAAS